jgi:hypothetical protein
MSPGKHDPWVNGKRLPGVTLDYNERVTIASGPYAGRHGWLVGLDMHGNEPLFTVELDGDEPDQEVPQSQLRRTA